jgi:tetratricopeptide (TPR) repeat protein
MDEAHRDLDRALAAHPALAWALLAKAECYFAKGEFELALVFFQRGGLAGGRRFRAGAAKCATALREAVDGIARFHPHPAFGVDAAVARGCAALTLLPRALQPLGMAGACAEVLGELAIDCEYLLELREKARAEEAVAAIADKALVCVAQHAGAFFHAIV